jgi:UDP-3-O-[3-hydroxymyristoyl] glucosamine N-acyltransferase
MKLQTIVEALGGELVGDDQLEIFGIAPLSEAQNQHLSFLHNPKYAAQLVYSQAGCVIVSPSVRALAVARGAAIITPDPYYYFARLTQLWKRNYGVEQHSFIHPSSVIDTQAYVDKTAYIGPLCVIEKGSVIGAYSVLKSHVTVGHDCSIGQRCLIHSGVVIGSDGFGFAHHAGQWEKIEQLGCVSIGDDVEIGANTCIDRGALGNTVVADGVKLDNLIQIAHNVRIGKHTAIAACVGIAGSTSIGAHCSVGGAAAVLGHVQLADNVHVSASTTITKSIMKAGTYTGFHPFEESSLWKRSAVNLKQLSALKERIKWLEKNQIPSV